MVKNELCAKNYILHDSEVTAMVSKDSIISFVFENGIFLILPNQEVSKSNSCRMEVLVESLDTNRMFEHVIIQQFNRNKRVEIDFARFLDLLKKHKFKIYMDFYSYFAKSVLLNGMIGRHEINFIITDVDKIDFIFE